MYGFAPNFSYKELTATNTGFKNEATGNNLARLRSLSHKLQCLRNAVGKPLYINSAYRDKLVNSAVGGSRTSFHCIGSAADISIMNLDKDDQKKLETAIYASLPREFIKYDTFYHIAYDFSRLGNNGPVMTFEEEMPNAFPPLKSPTGKIDF